MGLGIGESRIARKSIWSGERCDGQKMIILQFSSHSVSWHNLIKRSSAGISNEVKSGELNWRNDDLLATKLFLFLISCFLASSYNQAYECTVR